MFPDLSFEKSLVGQSTLPPVFFSRPNTQTLAFRRKNDRIKSDDR